MDGRRRPKYMLGDRLLERIFNLCSLLCVKIDTCDFKLIAHQKGFVAGHPWTPRAHRECPCSVNDVLMPLGYQYLLSVSPLQKGCFCLGSVG